MSAARWGRAGVKRAVLLCSFLAGCDGGRAAEDGAAAVLVATSEVDLPRHYRFSPEAIVVAAGTEVTWRNSDDFTHTVRVEGIDGGPLRIPPGDSATLVFPEPGEYPYVCTLHPHQMRGQVVVVPADGE